jgi:hypothetical protein
MRSGRCRSAAATSWLGEIADLLDRKVKKGLSFSIVNHLRWDLRQIFEIAVAEGHGTASGRFAIYSTRGTKACTSTDDHSTDQALHRSSRSAREDHCETGCPRRTQTGEIFGLTWARMSRDHVEIVQRLYRGTIDTPKTNQSVRRAAIPAGLAADIAMWRKFAVDTKPEAFVFASECKTPLAKENVWRRNILPRLSKIGLECANSSDAAHAR